MVTTVVELDLRLIGDAEERIAEINTMVDDLSDTEIELDVGGATRGVGGLNRNVADLDIGVMRLGNRFNTLGNLGVGAFSAIGSSIGSALTNLQRFITAGRDQGIVSTLLNEQREAFAEVQRLQSEVITPDVEGQLEMGIGLRTAEDRLTSLEQRTGVSDPFAPNAVSQASATLGQGRTGLFGGLANALVRFAPIAITLAANLGAIIAVVSVIRLFTNRIGSLNDLTANFVTIDGSVDSARRNLRGFTTELRTGTLRTLNDVSATTRLIFTRGLTGDQQAYVADLSRSLERVTGLTEEEALELLTLLEVGELNQAQFVQFAHQLGLTTQELEELIEVEGALAEHIDTIRDSQDDLTTSLQDLGDNFDELGRRITTNENFRKFVTFLTETLGGAIGLLSEAVTFIFDNSDKIAAFIVAVSGPFRIVSGIVTGIVEAIKFIIENVSRIPGFGGDEEEDTTDTGFGGNNRNRGNFGNRGDTSGIRPELLGPRLPSDAFVPIGRSRGRGITLDPPPPVNNAPTQIQVFMDSAPVRSVVRSEQNRIVRGVPLIL